MWMYTCLLYTSGRGQLVSAFLTSSCGAKDYVDNVASEWNDYSGFHLLAVNMYYILKH